MSNMNIPVGISDFRRIREENYYYIDKSGLYIYSFRKYTCAGYLDHTATALWKDFWE